MTFLIITDTCSSVKRAAVVAEEVVVAYFDIFKIGLADCDAASRFFAFFSEDQQLFSRCPIFPQIGHLGFADGFLSSFSALSSLSS
jgi:hypothetical protein